MTTYSVENFEGTKRRADGHARNGFKEVSFLDRTTQQ